jgi:LuxR family maltose regulon positive regulatory protein
LFAELEISRMVVHLGRGDLTAAYADFERLERLHHPEEGFVWDPLNRVVNIMAIAALFDENIEEATRWTAAMDAALAGVEHKFIGSPTRHAWLALDRGRLAAAGALADEALSVAGPDLAAGSHALVELFAVKSRVAAEHGDADEADAWAERAVDLAAELGDPLHQMIARDAVIAAVEARSGSGEALEVLERMTVAAPIAGPFGPRQALTTAELALRCGRTAEAELVMFGRPAGIRAMLVDARLAVVQGQAELLDEILVTGPEWPTGRLIEAELVRHQAHPFESVHLHRALELGVDEGFVSTFVREGAVVRADLGRAVWATPSWRSSRLARALRDIPTSPTIVNADPLVEPLSVKEAQVLQFLHTHLSAIEIARQMFVSVNTVRTHIKGIYRKLGVSTRTDAVRRAVALGLIVDVPEQGAIQR